MVRLLCIIITLGLLNSLQAQNLSGKWVGYFTTNAGLTYPYEITIQDDGNVNLNATTLTKFSGNNLAKATAKGIFTKSTKLVSILETRFDQINLSPNTFACLMNNYLTYSKVNEREILQGTYISNNLSGNSDCGSGTVVLTKEQAFIITRKTNLRTKLIPNIKDSTTIINAKNITIPESKNNNPISKPDTIQKEMVANNNNVAIQVDTISKSSTAHTPSNEAKKNIFVPIPWVLISRENKTIKKIFTKDHKVSIGLFDNGSFESDSIAVYDNNVLIFDRIKLSYKAFQFELPLDEKNNRHEMVIVAHQPKNNSKNSAILLYKDAFTKEEFIINTSNKNNVKIIIQYEP